MLFLTEETIKAKTVVGDLKNTILVKQKIIEDMENNINKINSNIIELVEKQENLNELINFQEKQLFLKDFQLNECEKKISIFEEICKEYERTNWDSTYELKVKKKKIEEVTSKLKESEKVKVQLKQEISKMLEKYIEVKSYNQCLLDEKSDQHEKIDKLNLI